MNYELSSLKSSVRRSASNAPRKEFFHVDDDGVLHIDPPEPPPPPPQKKRSSASASTSTKKKRSITDSIFDFDDAPAPPSPPLPPPPSPPPPPPTPAPRRETINTWPDVETVANTAGVRSVTCVDPGTRNLAIMRMEYHPRIRITHARAIDLHVLCADYERTNPTVRLRTGREGEYSMQSEMFALREYVRREGAHGSGGCFESDMCLIEEQSFDRLMARVEATIVTAFESVCANPMIVVLPGADGGTIPAAQMVTARSVKACYRPLFPLTQPEKPKRHVRKEDYDSDDSDDSEDMEARPKAKKRPFGVGNVHASNDQQRRLHKRQAIKYGSLLVPPEALLRLIPAANLTAYDRERLAKSKMDDIYDTLFMCMYFISTYVFQFYKCRVRGFSRPLPAFETPPQRPHAAYEELIEIAAAVGTDRDALQQIIDALIGSDAPVIE